MGVLGGGQTLRSGQPLASLTVGLYRISYMNQEGGRLPIWEVWAPVKKKFRVFFGVSKIWHGDVASYWWWCAVDDDSFLEDAPAPWQKFVDSRTGRLWWYKDLRALTFSVGFWRRMSWRMQWVRRGLRDCIHEQTQDTCVHKYINLFPYEAAYINIPT